MLGSVAVPYVEGFSYCATNFDHDENNYGTISNRKVTELGEMLKLETEEWNYLDEVKRYWQQCVKYFIDIEYYFSIKYIHLPGDFQFGLTWMQNKIKWPTMSKVKFIKGAFCIFTHHCREMKIIG